MSRRTRIVPRVTPACTSTTCVQHSEENMKRDEAMVEALKTVLEYLYDIGEDAPDSASWQKRALRLAYIVEQALGPAQEVMAQLHLLIQLRTTVRALIDQYDDDENGELVGAVDFWMTQLERLDEERILPREALAMESVS